jgi:hypothetical protein
VHRRQSTIRSKWAQAAELGVLCCAQLCYVHLLRWPRVQCLQQVHWLHRIRQEQAVPVTSVPWVHTGSIAYAYNCCAQSLIASDNDTPNSPTKAVNRINNFNSQSDTHTRTLTDCAASNLVACTYPLLCPECLSWDWYARVISTVSISTLQAKSTRTGGSSMVLNVIETECTRSLARSLFPGAQRKMLGLQCARLVAEAVASGVTSYGR